MKKPQFKTGAFGIEYIDEKQAATRDTTVLPQMVNAKEAGDGAKLKDRDKK